MTTDNNTGKDKEFYNWGKMIFDRIQPEPEPEPFAPDWVNYRQGKIDGAREGCEWVGLTCIDYGLICREADDIASALLMAETLLKEKNT